MGQIYWEQKGYKFIFGIKKGASLSLFSSCCLPFFLLPLSLLSTYSSKIPIKNKKRREGGGDILPNGYGIFIILCSHMDVF